MKRHDVPRGDEPQGRKVVTTVIRLLLDERPSTLASACAPVATTAHAYAVGFAAAEGLLVNVGPEHKGISVSVSGLGFPTAINGTKKINISITGTTSANGAGMATSLQVQKASVQRDQKVWGDKARGIPPRGRPV